MRILYLHGLEGKPTGSKVAHLIGEHFIMSPTLPKDDFPESVRIARDALAEDPDLIIGSSRGGAVAMSLETAIPRILIAPAWKKFGADPASVTDRDIVIHSRDDDVVPFADSGALCPPARLVDAGSGHQSDPGKLEALGEEVASLDRHEKS